MSETTLTHINRPHTKGLWYANGEMAILEGDEIRSFCLKSSAIRWWSYNVVTKNLTVKYHSGEKYYKYEGVPYSIIIEMMFADSLGAFIAKTIKPNYSVNA
jgi:hypothetical protein